MRNLWECLLYLYRQRHIPSCTRPLIVGVKTES